MADVTPKFKVGDHVLFVKKYSEIEGQIFNLVTGKDTRFQSVDYSHYYKVRYGWFGRNIWVREDEVKGILTR